MPNNNENNYRIRSEFYAFIKDLPGLRITHTESVEFINVEIRQIQQQNSFAFFSRSDSRFSRISQYYLIDQLFKELEKDQFNNNELIDIGRTFKKYFQVLKMMDAHHTYYTMTPGMMASFFIVLHLTLLCFPESKPLIYGSLMSDFYVLGFWLFSVWSSRKYEQALRSLENQLIEKIDFLKSLSFSMPLDPYSFGSSSSILPTYSEVLLEDIRCIEMSTLSLTTSTFFYSQELNNECESDADNIDVRQIRRSHSR